MADKNDGGDKTEKPTPKKLQDARRKGQVPKSRDLSSTVPLAAWLAVFVLGTAYAGRELALLVDAALAAVDQPFEQAAPALGALAWRTGVALSALALLPAAAVGLVTEFLQAGPVFSSERLKPKAEHLNPVEGIKRMFTLDNLVELAKSLFKCVLLLLIGLLVLRGVMPDSARLFQAPGGVQATGALLMAVTQQALGWTLLGFVLVSVLDLAWQQHSFTRKLRMSLRDIRQETKESEGDPQVRQQRRQAHQEWSQRNAQQAARQANVLVVNPTHVAIAIDYDRDRCPVPVVSAKGEDHVARAMREAAEEAGVPIVRNVALARELLARGEVGALVPADLFDLVAEVVLWAREVRQAMQAGDGPPRQAAPGEDLSAYPGAAPGR
ncbi:EscU/YscU/HrcU family type III secretion system export apparatus switch protein [Rubrivivax gelatinosus]|uniref:EscU/YscU/HrcU family type III secretion system export apparatus switch protein n=1 Tax=Rubrivivax gelatinosus TaxID=28068 RepID=A0ABS1DXF9_RUBGE|nr:type III secretion system export apparatus subunit SctU [Rubrivivax gelatinosus]MBK1614363.1 EscU/YscU/HrcU family type III secretion system export apparatus switch protein [Rubrivivax gelatinosus]MBK1714203.1 EscU/YscU/HrcU family type III secretion system export apparatus switch protein [Rubrivivax gelatinosus]